MATTLRIAPYPKLLFRKLAYHLSFRIVKDQSGLIIFVYEQLNPLLTGLIVHGQLGYFIFAANKQAVFTQVATLREVSKGIPDFLHALLSGISGMGFRQKIKAFDKGAIAGTIVNSNPRSHARTVFWIQRVMVH